MNQFSFLQKEVSVKLWSILGRVKLLKYQGDEIGT